MKTLTANPNEQLAATAFTAQSAVFDEIYIDNAIVRYKRQRVRKHVLQYLQPGSTILELNSATGEDAIFFARQGNYVHATDISAGMQKKLRQKVMENGLETMISNELCSFTGLDRLKYQGPYDHIFSNFAGLNCTGDLDKVLTSLNGLLKPGGVITLVILPRFCLWEFLLIFKGMFKTAFRRVLSRHGTRAHVEGVYFTCWYYNPSYIENKLQKSFDLLAIEGLCTIVPPSYIEGFAERHPIAFAFLTRWENKLKSSWPWKYVGDYYIISMKRK